MARFRPPAGANPAPNVLWLRQALAAEADQRPPEPLPRRADVCIVGGGFTGLWTALGLKEREPSLDVVLIESGLCGGGASGRNGGFVMSAWSKFGSLAKLCGADDALRYARAAEAAIGEIGAYCERHAIHAEFRRAGWLWAATNEAQMGAWEDTVSALAAVGASPYTPLDREDVERLSGSPVHLGGILEPGAATVHPGHLVRGLARRARELGVHLAERTDVIALHAEPGPRADTTRGPIRADHVILAVNAWAAALPQARAALVTVASDVVATDPIPDELERIGWDTGFSISDSRRRVHYYRTTEDGRVVFGKGGGSVGRGARIGPGFDADGGCAAETRAHFHRTYPMLWKVPTPWQWRGAVDYSVSGLPFVGPLDGHPGVLIAAGFSGNGVGPAHVAGEALAGWVLGIDTGTIPEALRRPPRGRLPPEPLRHAGGVIVREAVTRKEEAEDLGRAPGRLLRRLAGLDPTSFIDRGTSTPGARAPVTGTAGDRDAARAPAMR